MSSVSTWSIVMPYRTDWLPAELLPIMPPSVARFLVEVSGPNTRPCRAPPGSSCSCTTPGCTRATRRSGSISMILFICRDRSITIACPTVWPARLVPAPRGSTGTLNSAAVVTTAATSAGSRGKTTPIGSIVYMLASVRRGTWCKSRTGPHHRPHGAALARVAPCGDTEGPVARRRDIVMAYESGRHFLQIPGPTNVPDRVRRAMAAPTIDHRGPEFAGWSATCWPAWGGCAAAQDLSPSIPRRAPAPGGRAGQHAVARRPRAGLRNRAFRDLWSQMGQELGLDVDVVPGDWRQGVQVGQVDERLAADPGHQVKAVIVVQNETSTGCASQIPLIRAAMDSASHPALLLSTRSRCSGRSSIATTSGASTSPIRCS